jgi:predicted phosphohydrolase
VPQRFCARRAALRVLVLGVAAAALSGAQTLRFALIGDRTGEHVEGVYEQVWKQVAALKPAFVLSVGDTIEGLEDAAAETQWQQVMHMLPALPLYLAPGNHDVWSAASEQLYRRYSKHDLHYGFDSGPVHVTVLDNSRSDEFSAAEVAFLEEDLKAHRAQPVKVVVSHRPSWLLNAMLGNTDFPLHQIAKKYGVQYVVAGHVHEMVRAAVEGVEYVSMASAGGHLRASGKYEDGWWFGFALIEVTDGRVKFELRELGEPYGKGRVTTLADWGKAGLNVPATRR